MGDTQVVNTPSLAALAGRKPFPHGIRHLAVLYTCSWRGESAASRSPEELVPPPSVLRLQLVFLGP
jgi:hypothetical protein